MASSMPSAAHISIASAAEYTSLSKYLKQVAPLPGKSFLGVQNIKLVFDFTQFVFVSDLFP